MTSKDKANKLCMTFLMETDIPSKAIAKQCALICVDEMLREIPKRFDSEERYWEDVKKEIQKL